MTPNKFSKDKSNFFFIHTFATLILYPIMFLLMFILIPVISIPLVIIRWAVDKIAHSKTDFVGLGEMVNTVDSVFLRDAIYSNPKCNCVVTFTVEGKLELSRLRETFRDKILNATMIDGSLKYPKFRQRLKQWCGYSFWSDVLGFDVENQINLQRLQHRSKLGESNEDTIREMTQRMINQPWVEGQTLWDITLLHNYQPSGCSKGQPYSCIVFRMHHILGDGYSLSCILKDWLSVQSESVLHIKSERRHPSFFERTDNFLWNVALPFRIAYHTTEIVATLLACDSEWFIPQHSQATGKTWSQSTGPIPVKMIKDIKNHYEVNFTSVLWAVQIGAHHEVLKSKGQIVPAYLPSAVSVLLPGHTGKMDINSVVSLMKLPLGEEDLVRRLRKCHEEEKRTRSFIGAIFAMNFVKFCGLFPPQMIKWFMAKAAAFVTSNMSFNDFELYADPDYSRNFITRVSGTSGLQIGTQGVFIANISYNGYIIFNTTVHEAVMGEKESLQFSSAIINQINTLHQLID